MSDGTRTRGHLDHNQVLYQLSYTHHLSGAFPLRQEELYRIREGARARVSGRRGHLLGGRSEPAHPARAGPGEPAASTLGRSGRPRALPGQSEGSWYFAAMARAVSLSGPGCSTNTASR